MADERIEIGTAYMNYSLAENFFYDLINYLRYTEARVRTPHYQGQQRPSEYQDPSICIQLNVMYTF